MAAPFIYQWNGEAMVPLARFHNAANAEFVVGELYRMDAMEERSQRSHNHYFAALHEAWLNLPDEMAVEFASVEALRKHALIMTGYREERKFAAASREEARRLAAFIKPRDGYAIISVHDNVVVEWTAKSQSRKAMGGPTFQRSKDDVLEFVAGLLDVEPRELSAAVHAPEQMERAG
jgi:hypothetical protein